MFTDLSLKLILVVSSGIVSPVNSCICGMEVFRSSLVSGCIGLSGFLEDWASSLSCRVVLACLFAVVQGARRGCKLLSAGLLRDVLGSVSGQADTGSVAPSGKC